MTSVHRIRCSVSDRWEWEHQPSSCIQCLECPADWVCLTERSGAPCRMFCWNPLKWHYRLDKSILVIMWSRLIMVAVVGLWWTAKLSAPSVLFVRRRYRPSRMISHGSMAANEHDDVTTSHRCFASSCTGFQCGSAPAIRVHSHWYEYESGCLHTGSSKHRYACIPIVAVHIYTSSVQVRVTCEFHSYEHFLSRSCFYSTRTM